MRWLHLTDIHVGRPDHAQSTALQSLLEAIDATSDGKPFDALLITGDLAYSGLSAEYDHFDSLLLGPLRQREIFRKATAIAIPGNHDLDCTKALPCAWNLLDKKRQSKWFSNDIDGATVRRPRGVAFSDYASFCKRALLKTLDPTSECVRIHRLDEFPQRPLVVLNTAFFSDADRSDEGLAPAPVLALRGAIQQLGSGTSPIVLGHHPIAWFSHITQEPFRSALLEANALYLHGHLHQVRVAHSQKGVESLGFGAV